MNDLSDMIQRMKGGAYYEKQDIEMLETKMESKIENLFKKVKFYQKSEKNYMVPSDLKDLVKIKDEEELYGLI